MVGASVQPKRRQYVGDPYVKKDYFYVFDDFEFKRGFKIFDNQYSTRNINHFVANDAIPFFCDAQRLGQEALAEYLVMEDRKDGVPVFVDNALLALSEPEQLEVAFAHLMRDFDSVSQSSQVPQELMMTKQNIKDMQVYLSENKSDDKTMASMIEMVRVGRLRAIENKEFKQNHNVVSDKSVRGKTFIHKNKVPHAPKIAWYDGGGDAK
jgi:hypothetical protein